MNINYNIKSKPKTFSIVPFGGIFIFNEQLYVRTINRRLEEAVKNGGGVGPDLYVNDKGQMRQNDTTLVFNAIELATGKTVYFEYPTEVDYYDNCEITFS